MPGTSDTRKATIAGPCYPHPMLLRVLFICTHNSARSQMAEGMLRAWGGADWEAHSAGVAASFVRLEAIEAMEEIGIDINGQQSKSLDRYVGQAWDYVIPVCEEGAAACPRIPGSHVVETWQFDDPAAAVGTDEERLTVFRRVRDEIAAKVRDFLERHPREP
jgi:arsenate reductase